MNIAIEARALSMQGGGVKTYTRELIQHLPIHAEGSILSLITAGELQAINTNGYNLLPLPLYSELEILSNSWLSWRVQKALKNITPDLVHYTKAAVPNSTAYPSVVTIHDVIPLLFRESQALAAAWYWPHALHQASQKSNHIITISETSKQDIIKYLNVPAEKITVTPLAVNLEKFKPLPQDEITSKVQEIGVNAPYILLVATRDIRKNISSLLTAFAQIRKTIPHSLIIAGKPALKNDHTHELLTTLNLADRVTFLNFVPEDMLPVLYSGAAAFIWPSIYEGWGLPILEAMACGVPTIVSNGGALPEVVGSAAAVVPFTTDNLHDRLHDIDFINRLAQTIESVLSDKQKQETMRLAGLHQVKQFSWDTVALKTWGVYKKVLA